MARLLEQFKGCMVGGLVGDCLGANFECQYENLVPIEKVDSFLDKLRKNEPASKFRYTDDSAMAKQIASSFVKQQAFDYKDIASRFSVDYHREPWRGYGGSVVEVFSKLKANPADPFTPAAQQFNGSGSYGNGAGMRAHPIALGAYPLQVHEVINHATNVGRITHSHPLGVGGGILQTLSVHFALHGEKPVDILDKVRAEMKKVEENAAEPQYTHKLQLVEEFLDKPDSDLAEMGFELGNDVSAIESVPTALFCFLRACRQFKPENQFEETIRLAIHLGGDTDTIASMAGAITGAYLGIQSIPEYMRRPCEALDEVIGHAEDIFNIVNKMDNASDATKRPVNGGTDTGEQPPEKKSRDD